MNPWHWYAVSVAVVLLLSWATIYHITVPLDEETERMVRKWAERKHP